MGRSTVFLAALCWALCWNLSGQVHAQPPNQQPEEVAHEFYSWVLAHPSWSMPSAEERAQLAKVLAPDLMRLLSEAAQAETRCIKAAAVGDKPYDLEGDLFVGNHEGATEVAYGELQRSTQTRSAQTATIDAHLIYVDPRFPKAHQHRAVAWTDTVELRLLAGRWLVAEIKLNQREPLTVGLQSYIATAARFCGKP